MSKKKEFDDLMKQMAEFRLMKQMAEYSPVIITKEGAPSKKVSVMHVFALMHHPDVFDGDVEIMYSNESTKNITVISAMDMTYEDFWREFNGFKGFHCRVKLPWMNSKSGLHYREIAFISENYNFVYDMMLDGAPLLLHGGMSWKTAEMSDLYDNVIHPLVEKLRCGISIPAKKFVNPAPEMLRYKSKLKKYRMDNNGKIHVAERTEKHDEISYACFRPEFDFFCLNEIVCCGQCPMMYKAYEHLVNEALDKASAERLSKMVEDVGIFALEAGDGTRKCKYSCCDDHCKDDVHIAIEEIRRYWYECYDLH